MTDIVDAATRSRMMSGIRSRDTKPELVVRRLLHALGFRFRLHAKDLPGKPDIVLPKYRAIILVHGCFWHGHDCSLFRLPATRTDFWREKIQRNQARDGKVVEELAAMGWRVAIVWECAVRSSTNDRLGLAESLSSWLKGDKPMLNFSHEKRLPV